MTSEVNETLPTPNWDHEENLTKISTKSIKPFSSKEQLTGQNLIDSVGNWTY